MTTLREKPVNEIANYENVDADEVYASRTIDFLLRSYPQQKPHDPDVYIRQLVMLCTGIPRLTLKSMVHPKTGIIAKCKFLPTVAEVSDWLGENLPLERVSPIWKPIAHLNEPPIPQEEKQRRLEMWAKTKAEIEAAARATQRASPPLKAWKATETDAAAGRSEGLKYLDAMRGETQEQSED